MRSPKDGQLLGLEWGTINQVSNIMCADQNIPKGRTQYDVLLDASEEFFVGPHVLVMGKYLEIFHLGVGESTGLLGTNWEMS